MFGSYYNRTQDTVPHFAGLDKETGKGVWIDMAPIEKAAGKRHENYIFRPCNTHAIVIDESEISMVATRRVELEALLQPKPDIESSD